MSLPTSIPVLMYHHIAPDDGGHCVHPERLREQLRWLRDQKIRILSGHEYSQISKGLSRLDSPAVLLTFDDGWLDNWVYALPILQEFNASAIFFVVTSWPGSGDARTALRTADWKGFKHSECMKLSVTAQRDQVLMRWSELQHAAATGLVELHSHSHSHGGWWKPRGDEPILENVISDLARSREELRARTGTQAAQLCWPRGEFTAAMQTAARRVGFEMQYSTLRGANEPGRGSRVVRRLHVENRELDWFISRVRFYSRALPSRTLGWCHQGLQRVRMRRRHATIWSEQGGLGPNWWRLV